MARPVNTSSSNTVDRFFISLEQDFGVPQTVMRDNSCEFISLAYLEALIEVGVHDAYEAPASADDLDAP
jgi:hypothetical protein